MDRRLQYILFAVAAAVLVYFQFIKPRHTPQVTQGPGTAQVEAPTGDRPAEQRFRVETPRTTGQAGLTAELTTRSGGVRALRLAGAQFQETLPTGARVPMDIATTERESWLPLRTDLVVQRNGATVSPAAMDFTGHQTGPGEVVLEWHGADLDVVRTVRGERAFALRVLTRVTNRGAPVTVDFRLPLYRWVTREDESGGFFRQSWKVAEGLCSHDGDLFREGRDKLTDRASDDPIPGTARFVGIGNLYFVSALVPRDGDVTRCRLHAEDHAAVEGDEPVGSLFSSSLGWPRQTLATGESHEFAATAYFGPKETNLLRATDASLTQTVNLGFFALIARWLVKFLQFLYSIVHNWGIAIILLTVCVRVALFPLLARSTKSLAMMQQLKPELDALNERFKDNQEQKGLATMELYRKHGINPLSGCLPQVAQLPVWWALYTTLQTSVELFHAPFFLWWQDLSARDPYFVLPLVLGAVMFIQQRLMPPQAMDPVQAKMMMYMMPVFLTAISLFLPAGLALYMLVNSLLGIAQQKYAKAQMAKITLAMAGTGGGQGIVVRPADGGSRG